MTDQVYVRLLDEGTGVWRPVPTWKVGPQSYIVLRPDEYDPDVERWEFPPGSVVECESRQVSEGPTLVAVRIANASRQTA
jgi:hypothetical protein